jgi:hypothetical protein
MLGTQNGLLLDGFPSHSYILDNGWQEGLGKPLSLIGLVEVEGAPLPMLKPNLDPPLEKNLEVGVEGMGFGMLGIIKDGVDDTTDVP